MKTFVIKSRAEIRREDVFVVSEFILAKKRGLSKDDAMIDAVTQLYCQMLRNRKYSKHLIESTGHGKINYYNLIIERMGEIFYINVLRPQIRNYIERDVKFNNYCDVLRAKFNGC